MPGMFDQLMQSQPPPSGPYFDSQAMPPPQMQPPVQGNNPYPSPQEGLQFLLSLMDPGTIETGLARNPQGGIDPMGTLGNAMNAGGALVGLAGMPGKGQLGGMAGRIMGGSDELARATGGFADNAAGSIRGNVPGGGRPPVDPGNLRAMDDMAPLGGGAPPSEVPNQAWNDMIGPDDFRHQDDWMRHQDQMSAGPMQMMASSADPARLIEQAALDMIQQGVSPAEAIQAATLQFSDLLIP